MQAARTARGDCVAIRDERGAELGDGQAAAQTRQQQRVFAEARADAQGRFSFALAAMLKPGDHALVVQSPGGQAGARFSVSRSGPISGLPFRGERQAGDWRIDWLTPAGGAQTTLIMD